VHVTCHPMSDDPRVTVQQGRPLIYSLQQYVIVSIPTTPRRGPRARRSTGPSGTGGAGRGASRS
jgi:hypothetical protein